MVRRCPSPNALWPPSQTAGGEVACLPACPTGGSARSETGGMTPKKLDSPGAPPLRRPAPGAFPKSCVRLGSIGVQCGASKLSSFPAWAPVTYLAHDTKRPEGDTDKAAMNAAQLFVRCLENEGVKDVYGIPGGEHPHGRRLCRVVIHPLHPRPPRAGRLLHGRYLWASHGSGRSVHGDTRARRAQPRPRHYRREYRQRATRRDQRAGGPQPHLQGVPPERRRGERVQAAHEVGRSGPVRRGVSRWCGALSSRPRPSGLEP